jgi:hypothetical protein
MQRILAAFLVSSCSFVLAPSAFAQSNDSCANAILVSGLASIPFDNSAATTGPEGQNETICNLGGATGIDNDLWYTWTATADMHIEVTTCGTTSLDTKIAVYLGTSCPAGQAGVCNDDACGPQSSVHGNVPAGSVFTIQVGVRPGTPGGAGTLLFRAFVPPVCSPSVGPDVIVGDIPEVENATPTGPLDAISLGTTSCNIGTVNLEWQASTNQHPVIGGNLYRYRVVAGAGRFEQIGMSWLKHGFFALSQELCCGGCAGTDGTQLGVNCSDPYTAQRNGIQGSLGPRRQVNAHTGAFTYPPANPGWSGTTARRCEFALADIDASAGVKYYGECQYITPDDAAAGNQNNNASHRELVVGGTPADRFLGLTGTTQRTEPAIRAWPLVDPGTVLSDVQVPGDGLLVVGSHATSLGGGQHHYEYAVYNMNADRCGASFSIPIPTGVVVTNIGFHDVTYRNGDGGGNVSFSDLDWTVTQAGGALTWSCLPEATDPNANALRWGTTYNFRFDADVGPANGLATIGLWKTGSPAMVTASVDVPGSGAASYAYCFGDGSGTSCPCGNNSSPFQNAGCLSSLGSPGQLVATGVSSVSADTLSLSGSGMPDSSALYFQGTAKVAAGVGAVFGDGLRCAGGTVIRLGIETNAGGASHYPGAGDALVSVRGGNAAGNVRTYQAWYRNAAAFCSAETFNLTNGWRLAWSP